MRELASEREGVLHTPPTLSRTTGRAHTRGRRWLLERVPAHAIFFAGDSAGGGAPVSASPWHAGRVPVGSAEVSLVRRPRRRGDGGGARVGAAAARGRHDALAVAGPLGLLQAIYMLA